MQDIGEILWPAVAPVVIAAIGVPLAAWLHRGEPAWRRSPAWLGLVIAVAYAVSHWGLRGWQGFPPGNVHDWMPFIALSSVLLLFCASCVGNGWWQTAMRLLLTSGTVAVLLSKRFPIWTATDITMWVGGLGIAWALVLIAWERVARASTPGVAVVGLLLVALWSSLALVLFGSMTHGQFAGMIAAALGVVMVLAWWRPSLWSDTGAATVAGLVLPGLWVLGLFYFGPALPYWVPLMLALAGCAPWLATIPALRGRAPWQRLLVVVLASTALAAPVLIAGGIASPKPAAESGGPSYK